MRRSFCAASRARARLRGSFAISLAFAVICRPFGLRMKALIRFNKPAITFSSLSRFVTADVPTAGAPNPRTAVPPFVTLDT